VFHVGDIDFLHNLVLHIQELEDGGLSRDEVDLRVLMPETELAIGKNPATHCLKVGLAPLMKRFTSGRPFKRHPEQLSKRALTAFVSAAA